MDPIEALLDKGLEHHQAGRLREAERLYQEVLRVSPLHANALHLLGLVHHQRGEHEAAVELIRQALGVQPGSEVFWSNLAAVSCALGRYGEAAEAGRQAVHLNPSSAKAHLNLGCALNGLGDPDAAAASFQRALSIDLAYTQAHSNLGIALHHQGKLDEAVRSYQRALSINPGYAEAHSNLGVSLRHQGKLDEAAASLQRALSINPGYAEAHCNLGIVWRQQGNLDEAVRSYQRALSINPGYAEAHMNLGHALLQMGDFEQGWSHYEWRWRTTDNAFKPRKFAAPLWDGRPLQGRSLLVHAEQGLGDTLQFIRYAPLVRERGCRVIVECHNSLRELLRSCPGINQLMARGEELPTFDFHVPLLTLPSLLGTNAGNIPADVPYLCVREDLVRDWQGRLRECAGLRIGIAWQGSPTHAEDRQRSFALAQFAALAEVPGVDLISLQKGIGAEQLGSARFPVTVLGTDLDAAHWDFMHTAAVMRNLDLVIAADTAVAHLAGALGLPVWVALARVPDWRWLLGREDTPWYPTMRLFRQEKAGDWEPVFRRIGEALRQRLSARQ